MINESKVSDPKVQILVDEVPGGDQYKKNITLKNPTKWKFEPMRRKRPKSAWSNGYRKIQYCKELALHNEDLPSNLHVAERRLDLPR
jgi:hypothetical protein